MWIDLGAEIAEEFKALQMDRPLGDGLRIRSRNHKSDPEASKRWQRGQTRKEWAKAYRKTSTVHKAFRKKVEADPKRRAYKTEWARKKRALGASCTK